MIPVRTNPQGIVATEDLRRANIELGGVMKRLQTGKRVNSASEDIGALVQSNTLTRALSTLQIAQEQVAKGQSILSKIEDTVDGIYNILAQLKMNAERATQSSDSAEITSLQNASNVLYEEIRKLVRSTVFQKQQLIRGGLGNRVIGPVSIVFVTGATPITIFRHKEDIDVTGINLGGYASGTRADVSVSNLVTVLGNSGGPVQGAMFTSSVVFGGLASVRFNIAGGIATSELFIDGNAVFTESIRINFTGAQVLDFVNLGMRIYVENVTGGGIGQGTTLQGGTPVVITLQRGEARFFRGTNVSTELDYVHFDIPNLEPENLLGSISLGGGSIFTFDMRSSPETAVTIINEAIEYIENIRARVGAVKHMLEVSQTQVQSQRIIAQVQRSAIIDAKFDEEALHLTALQVVQQSANAMVAISRLTPQLVLQLLGGG
ncbi:MAG: flagellin [Candidatus Calescibacterium sp.]|nr:flagellin [Candidatus Calescibacterium sp.]MDW8086915.1 flagellin [Candidatus Calescibacterium sp.]